jgi:hypothetical protein
VCQGEGVHSLSLVLMIHNYLACLRKKMICLQNFWLFVAKLPHFSVTILQNPEPEVEFDTVANEKKQHEVNVG